MLLDISKLLLLVVQVITTTTLINIILLSSCCSSGVKSLPITSKPIESTAENLAWEAWLTVPVNQQQKSRKVTPKSIFIVPHKNNQSINCPPGEHWSTQNRCVPIVAIDTDKAFLNTLVQYRPADAFDYDYDYDEESNLSPAGAEKLEGSADTNPFSGGDFVDEPLKFNIFSETFPIGSFGSGDSSSGLKDPEDEKFFIVSESRRRRPPTPPEIPLPDLDTDSSNSGPIHNENGNGDFKNPDDGSTLFLSGIDAILVPAVSENQQKNQNINFSIYHETLNATMPQIRPTDETIKHDIDEFLKNESLFLDINGSSQTKTTTTTTTTEKTTSSLSWDTTTMKLEQYDDYEGKTEFTRSITDLPPIAEETSQPTIFEKDVTSTSVPNEDTTMITEPKEDDITTIASLSEDLNKTEPTSSNADISTITVSNEETTTITTSAKEEIATSDLTIEEETTIITSVKEDLSISNDKAIPSQDPNEDHVSEENASNNRFVYHKLTEEEALPPVINIVEELRKINDLVARNTRPIITTTQKPSEEATSNQNDLLSKIILSSITMKTSSEDPIPLSSTSTVWSSNSTSRNILSKNSSSSSRSSSTVSSTEESQESTADPSSSTSPTIPDISEPDPYWWLPRGWSPERTETDRPLLLRFWSAISGISGSQTKV